MKKSYQHLSCLLYYLQYRQLPQSSFLRQPAQSPQKTLFLIPFPPFPLRLAPREAEGEELAGEETSSTRTRFSAGPSSVLSRLTLRTSEAGSVLVAASCASTVFTLLSVTSAGFCCFFGALEGRGLVALAAGYCGNRWAELVAAIALWYSSSWAPIRCSSASFEDVTSSSCL